MNFTIQNVLIAAVDGYNTVEVQVVNGIIAAIEPSLDAIGTAINGENKLYLQRIGYLSDRTSLAHCVWLTDADIDILAETKSTVVHNPLSNLRLSSGIAPILKYRQKVGIDTSSPFLGVAEGRAQIALMPLLQCGRCT